MTKHHDTDPDGEPKPKYDVNDFLQDTVREKHFPSPRPEPEEKEKRRRR